MDSLSKERLQDENVYIKKITVSRVNETTSPEEKRNNAMHYTVTCPMKEVLGFNLDNNLRDFYGSDDSCKNKTSVHKEIKASFEENPTRFIQRNSGFTVVCSGIEVPQKDEFGVKNITLTNPSLINGAQTQGMLKEISKEYGGELDKTNVRVEIIVEKNPMYWDANTVRLNEIHYYPVQNVMTEDRMFRAGQLHITSTLPSQKCPVYIEENNPDLRIDPYMGTYFYRLNTKHPVLSDPKVRRALAFSIDRKQIVDKVTKCGQIPAYSFTPPGSNGYEPDTSISFDPEYAKTLLKEAGYDENNPFPELEILFNTNEDHRKVALAVQQMWQQNLGVQIKLVNQDWKVYLNREMIGDFEVSRAGWIGL